VHQDPEVGGARDTGEARPFVGFEPLAAAMRITRIRVHQVDLPLVEGAYSWSNQNSVSTFDSTVVAIETDEGLAGYGEVCPLGPAYLPSYAEGARTGIATLAPALIGLDPTALGVVNRRMDQAMRGHPYVKSALDMACWDLLGQTTGQPVCELMGGRHGDDFALYRAISQDSPEAMAERVAQYRAEGYRKFQLKVGGDPITDIERIERAAARLEAGDLLIADANTGWSMHDATRRRCRARPRRVHRAAVCQLRGVPDRAPAHRKTLRARRGHGRHAGGRARPGRRRDGCHQPEDFQGGRAHARAKSAISASPWALP
jgi:hypothetical protein